MLSLEELQEKLVNEMLIEWKIIKHFDKNSLYFKHDATEYYIIITTTDKKDIWKKGYFYSFRKDKTNSGMSYPCEDSKELIEIAKKYVDFRINEKQLKLF